MTTLALRQPNGLQPGPRGPAAGLGISLLVHAAVLAWLARLPAPRETAPAAVARLEVRLAPRKPSQPVQNEVPAASAPAHPAEAPRRPPRARRAAHAGARKPAGGREASAVEAAPAVRARDPFAVPPAATAPAPDADTHAVPSVDLAAARLAARQIAHEQGKSLVALPQRKPVVDPNPERQPDDPLERARRSDCRTAYAGMGLLALIPLAASAVTDTGCKW